MSIVKKGASAFGKLFIVIALAGTFLVGLVGVVYMSLQGEEIKVPDIVGKDFTASEEELAALGLRIKKRADRFSTEKPNTILEQLPKAGETVKTGQMILVVRSKWNPEGEETPATIKKNDDEDDSEKIEELISDKPKKTTKTNSNSNKKKTSTTRDVLSNNSDNSNDNSAGNSNSNKKSSDANDNSSKGNKNSSTTPGNKSTTKDTETKKNTETDKPKPNKTPNSGDVRPRKTPQP
ncbi:MAG: PASTA domain-containing protein [Pyrinomonadaceae bacterium]